MKTKQHFLNQIPRYAILSEKDVLEAEDSFHLSIHAKHELLLKTGQICRLLYFNCQGLVRSFLDTEDSKVLWYEFEHSFFTDVTSFFTKEPSKANIEVLEEDTTLLSISLDDLNRLFEKNHKWAFWGTQLQQYEFVKLTNHYENLRIKDASERYHRLLEMYPQILQRASLGGIASYLGISQVSLSRIRAGKQKKDAF